VHPRPSASVDDTVHSPPNPDRACAPPSPEFPHRVSVRIAYLLRSPITSIRRNTAYARRRPESRALSTIATGDAGLRHIREQGLVDRGDMRRMSKVDPVGCPSTPPGASPAAPPSGCGTAPAGTQWDHLVHPGAVPEVVAQFVVGRAGACHQGAHSRLSRAGFQPFTSGCGKSCSPSCTHFPSSCRQTKARPSRSRPTATALGVLVA